MKLSDIVVADALRASLQSTTRDEAITELVTALADAGAVDASQIDTMVKAVIQREKQATTGFGKGIALPHAKLKGIKKPLVAIGGSAEGIDFNSLDSKPVFSVILLLSSPDHPDEHLQAMETIFRHAQREQFRSFLRQAKTNDAIGDLIAEVDNE